VPAVAKTHRTVVRMLIQVTAMYSLLLSRSQVPNAGVGRAILPGAVGEHLLPPLAPRVSHKPVSSLLLLHHHMTCDSLASYGHLLVIDSKWIRAHPTQVWPHL
jgi:hypothetical protein